jgi:hypothetical protein
MSLADAFNGMPPKRSGAQVPEKKGQHAKPPNLSAEARKRIAEAMKRRWKERAQQARKNSGAQVPKRPSVESPRLPLEGTAKSRHPEFEAVKVYLRQRTHKAARRKFEDAGEGDFSDLVERLLQKYLGSER